MMFVMRQTAPQPPTQQCGEGCGGTGRMSPWRQRWLWQWDATCSWSL